MTVFDNINYTKKGGILRFQLFLLLLTLSLNVKTQSNNYLGHIGSEDGLSSQLCLKVIEDNYGNIWISSFQDLQKYNGHSISVLPLEDLKGEQHDGVIDLCKDANGMIWLLQGKANSKEFDKNWTVNHEYNINIIDPLTNEFIEFEEYIQSSKLTENEILKIHPFDEKIFITTKKNKIFTFTDKLEFYSSFKDTSTYLSINQNGEIISFDNDTIKFSNQKGETKNRINPNKLNSYDAFVFSPTGKLFLLNENNNRVTISLFSEGNITEITSKKRDLFNQVHIKYTTIELYDDGHLLVSHKLFRKVNEGYSTDYNLKLNDYEISETGLGYAATNLGVYVINNNKKLFANLANDEKNLNSVRGILINKDIQLYKVYNKETISSSSEKYDLSFLKDIDLGYMAIMHYWDPLNKKNLWTTGLIPGRVRKIDFDNKKIHEFKFSPIDPSYPNIILRSSTSNKVYLCSASGQYVLNENEEQFQRLDLECLKNPSTETHHIIEHENQIWIASSEGLIIINEENNSAILKPITVDSINLFIQYIHIDHIDSNIFWLGTRRGGLIKWDKRTDSTTVYNTEHGLANNDIHAIIEDKAERLWFSTNRYLHCLDKRTDNISVFTEQDGISHSEFNKYSFFHDSIQNQIYFGGLNGYNYFNPDSINTSFDKNKIDVRLIDAFKIKTDGFSENIFFKSLKSKTITLYEKDVSVQLYLSTNFLYDSKKTQFSYRIPGILDNWKTQSSNDIKLNRLPYGNYKLELIADLNKPAFTSNILSIDIKVIQPFYKTWIFYILLTLSFFLLVWLAVQKYLSNIKARNASLENTVKLRTKELRELNNTKNKIFTILAHDLRNPVSSLVNLTDKIKFLFKYNRMEELDILAEQTKSKINALNDNLSNVLYWALNENNMLNLKSQKATLYLEIKKILAIYSVDILEKNISIQNELQDTDQVFLDISILQTILRNFISNAIKFSYNDGILIFRKEKENEKRLELVIQDNGIGIQNERLDEDNSIESELRKKGKGSGIGMLISKELAEKAGVIINIKSEKNKGTVILLDMPKL